MPPTARLRTRVTTCPPTPDVEVCVDQRPTTSCACTADTPLHGEIRVRGAKNLVSKAMVATLLGDTPSRLYDVPRIRDVEVVRGLLELHGVRVTEERRRRAGLRPDQRGDAPTSTRSTCTPGRAGSRSCSAGRCCTGSATRSSPTSAAATSATGRSTSTSRRCASSARSSRRRPQGLHLTAPNGLHGTKFDLPYPSVGATEQVLLTAVRAEGVTELRNAAVEPEIIDLICVLQKMGAIIKVHTDRVIEIEGVPAAARLQPPADPGPARGGELGLRRAGHRRRHHRPRRPPGRHDDVPQRVHARSAARSRSTTGPTAASGSGTPATSCSAGGASRPTCTPAS